MTGQGHAKSEGPQGWFAVELRSVNNRFFKLAARWSEGLTPLEPRAEQLIRSRIARGTLHLSAAWTRDDQPAYQVHLPTLDYYLREYEGLCERRCRRKLPDRGSSGQTASNDPNADDRNAVAMLMALPGVVNLLNDQRVDVDGLWSAFEPCLTKALDQLEEMRTQEGAAMGEKLVADCQLIREYVKRMQDRAPLVIEGYRDRMLSKVDAVIKDLGIQAQPADVLREVQLFVDRCDLSEEITRLNSHLEMFNRALKDDSGAGRKLDFVIQEMFREVNTIGSKANDAEIAGYVVECKCAIERMRELVQNLE
jgi:uncharacterized protein (TIGR00255 family)